VSDASGGAGAVRELSELILFATNKLALAYAPYLRDDVTAQLKMM
jgi:3-deoxy-D-manno-octulosonate 8-phosphate phosphatase KdsC-like HAD superfamily phosphatase